MKFSSVPAYSFGKNRSQEKLEMIPGPAKYEVNWKKLSMKKSTKGVPFNRASEERSYPLSRKKAAIYEHIIEQENSYQSKFSRKSLQRLNRSKEISGRRRSSRLRLKKKGLPSYNLRLRESFYNYKVGPGSYDVYQSSLTRKDSAVIPKGPKNFSSRTAEKLRKRMPGPGQYLGQISTLGRKGGVRTKAKTGRLSMNKEALSKPGPADYNYNFSSFTRKGVSKIKPPSRHRSKEPMPGPGDYEGSVSTFSLNKGVPIPRVGRKNTIEKSPGPGDYNIYGRTRSKGIKIAKAKSTSKIQNTPGPGKYNVEFSSFGNQGVSKIGKSKRWLNIEEYPGPGKYGNNKEKSKGVIFNKSNRWKEKRRNKVGPGSYNIKRSVPDVAKYLLPQI